MERPGGMAIWRKIGPSSKPGDADPEIPVVIIGAGPVGLALALDLGLRGHRVVVLNRLDFVAGGSRAICFAKRSLEIFDRLGVGQGIVDQGVVWNVGKVFRGSSDQPIYQFDMLPVADQKRPGFINIQQYHVEDHLLAALAKLKNVEIRWGHETVGVIPRHDSTSVSVVTADGGYTIEAAWLIACDGSRSTVRDLMRLDFEGRVFEDNFLIADVRIKMERPAERWFWFDPPFNPGQSALLHKQPDDIWRIDFQLGWDIDRRAAVLPENVEPLVSAMLGTDVAFTREWYSIYTFQCRRMARFVHGRVIFAGDSAHLVSPFGARGCNGGLADADNLGWKLDLVLRGKADVQLLETYNEEAITTADENIAASSRSTDFMTPKTKASKALRDAVLELSQNQAFARPFVNSGRLSVAVAYPESSLNTADAEVWSDGLRPGSAFVDAPIGDRWLSDWLGNDFLLVANGWQGPLPDDVEVIDVANLTSGSSILCQRYALQSGSAYLFRPDQYVAARWLFGAPILITFGLRR